MKVNEWLFIYVKRPLSKEESEKVKKWYWEYQRPTIKIVFDHPEWLGFEI